MNGWRSLSYLLLSLHVFGRETRKTSWSSAPSPIRQIIQLRIYRLDNLRVKLSRPNGVLSFDGCQYGKMPDNVPIGISLLTGFVHFFLKPYCHFKKRDGTNKEKKRVFTHFITIARRLLAVCVTYALTTLKRRASKSVDILRPCLVKNQGHSTVFKTRTNPDWNWCIVIH